MKTRLSNLTNSRQSRGFVLMAAVLLLGVVSMAVLLSSLSPSNVANEQSKKTQLALKEAKQAVLGYIALDSPASNDLAENGLTPQTNLKPGSIPCPDRDDDNDSGLHDYAFGNCVGSVYTYRFPGKEFLTGELRDSANEKLWYAISREFRVGSTAALNSLTEATLKINGHGEYVAVILAPGTALSGQTRNDPAVRSHFLEDENADNPTNFTLGVHSDHFNDRLIGISQKEWEDAVLRRVANEVLGKLNAYRATHGSFPRPAALTGAPDRAMTSSDDAYAGLLPVSQLWPEPQAPITQEKKNKDWFAQNEWYRLMYYVIAPAFAPGGDGHCNDLSQCLTLRNGDIDTKGIKALLIYAGREKDGQKRDTPTVAAYLEGEENAGNTDNLFELPPSGSASNDRFYIIK